MRLTTKKWIVFAAALSASSAAAKDRGAPYPEGALSLTGEAVFTGFGLAIGYYPEPGWMGELDFFSMAGQNADTVSSVSLMGKLFLRNAYFGFGPGLRTVTFEDNGYTTRGLPEGREGTIKGELRTFGYEAVCGIQRHDESGNVFGLDFFGGHMPVRTQSSSIRVTKSSDDAAATVRVRQDAERMPSFYVLRIRYGRIL